MKYFLIYENHSNLKTEEQFFQKNLHLLNKLNIIHPLQTNHKIRQELIEKNWITNKNQYKLYDLELAKIHLNLWENAIQNQNSITVIRSNSVTHPNFLKFQEIILNQINTYDLIIWGYNLNNPITVQTHSSFPRIFYTFPGNEIKEDSKTNNDLVDHNLFQSNPIDPQIVRLFEFTSLDCYSLSYQGAQKLLKLAIPFGEEDYLTQEASLYGSNFYVLNPIASYPNITFDIEINRHLETLKAYTSIPPLAVLS